MFTEPYFPTLQETDCSMQQHPTIPKQTEYQAL